MLITNVEISFQVLQFMESPEYSRFTRIVFDTAPTVSNFFSNFVLLLEYNAFVNSDWFQIISCRDILCDFFPSQTSMIHPLAK